MKEDLKKNTWKKMTPRLTMKDELELGMKTNRRVKEKFFKQMETSPG